MMKKIRTPLTLLVAGLLVFAVMAILPMHVEAFDPFSSTCDGDTADSSVCTEVSENRNPFDSGDGIVPTVANLLAALGGIIAVVIIIISGLRLITSGGDSAKLTQSRNAIIYAAGGIVVIVLARTILGFVIDRL
jgi:hypothetical protein